MGWVRLLGLICLQGLLVKGNIIFTTTEAFAGVATGEADAFHMEDKEYFSIPGLSGGSMVAFPINGNSMDPVIQNGDIVICRKLESINELKDNKVYAIRDNGKVWVKYVQKFTDRKGRVTRLKLISANHLEYDPFDLDLEKYEHQQYQYIDIYQVIRRISDF